MNIDSHKFEACCLISGGLYCNIDSHNFETHCLISELPFTDKVCHIAQPHCLNDDDDDDTCIANYGPCFNENSYKHSNLQDS